MSKYIFWKKSADEKKTCFTEWYFAIDIFYFIGKFKGLFPIRVQIDAVPPKPNLLYNYKNCWTNIENVYQCWLYVLYMTLYSGTVYNVECFMYNCFAHATIKFRFCELLGIFKRHKPY